MTSEHPTGHEADPTTALSTVTGDPIADPGLPEHEWRPTDVDPAAERRAERQVATLFTLSAVCTVLFIVSYFTFEIGDNWDTFLGLGTSNLALGLSLAGAMLFLGIGIIQWARKLMGDHEIVEQRHAVASTEEERQEFLQMLGTGVEESGIARRPLVRNSLLGAAGLVGIAPIVMLRDLGPTPNQVANAELGRGLEHTVWKAGMRIVTATTNRALKSTDLQVGDLVNAAPAIQFATNEEGERLFEGSDLQVLKSKAAVILLRMEPGDLTPAAGREDWNVDGIVCYSKICTHVGCPISLNERTTHHLLCPCHQSTFDLADNGRVVFGPAARALPQLPIMLDDEGYLVAQQDFTEPVGPSFWERNSEESL